MTILWAFVVSNIKNRNKSITWKPLEIVFMNFYSYILYKSLLSQWACMEDESIVLDLIACKKNVPEFYTSQQY